MVANYWNHVNVANNTLKYLGLPQLTRDEVQVSRLEDAIAVEMFKRKADGEETGHYYSNDYYRHQTPEFLKAA